MGSVSAGGGLRTCGENSQKGGKGNQCMFHFKFLCLRARKNDTLNAGLRENAVFISEENGENMAGSVNNLANSGHFRPQPNAGRVLADYYLKRRLARAG